MANFNKETNKIESFLLGNNFAESGTLTASANVVQGTILVRDSGKNWVPATSSTLIAGAGIGVAIEDVASGTTVPCDVGIGGRFNRGLLNVEGDPLTDAQCDILRGQGIIALTIHNIEK